MQVSVELDIAAESRRATRQAGYRGRVAIARIAMASTNKTAGAGPLARNQVPTFPMGGIARCEREPSNHLPRVQSG